MKRFFLSLFLICFIFSIPLSADDYAKYYGWHFENFGIDSLPWDIYEESYIGITPWDPMDIAFHAAYNAAFSIASGDCFGMSLLSLLIKEEEGHLGFCKPIYTYSGDSNGPSMEELRRAIIIMQCHEWSNAGINWIMDQFSGIHLQDPMYAYDQVNYYLSKGDPPMITIVKDYHLEGHTLVPYKTEEVGPKHYIYVYDSNRWFPKDSMYYLLDSNKIEIPSSTSWSFTMAGTLGTWGSSTNGFIFVTPISVVRATSRNPLELGAVLNELDGLFLAGAAVSQITDEKGRHFYKTSKDTHGKLSDIEFNPTSRIGNIVRMPITSGKGKGKAPEIYFIRGNAAKSLKFEVSNTGKNYKFTFAGKQTVLNLKASGGGKGRDEIKVNLIGKKKDEIEIKSKRGMPQFDIEMVKRVKGENEFRTFSVANLKLTKNTPIRLKVAENLKGVLVRSEKGSLKFDIKITETKGKKKEVIEGKSIFVPEKSWQMIAPADWQNLKKGKLRIEKFEQKAKMK